MSEHKHEHDEHEHGCSCGCHADEHEAQERDCCCGHEAHEHGSCCGHEDHEHEHHEHEHDGCSCGCGHDHGDDEEAKEELPRLILALGLFAAGMLLPVPALAKTLLLLACYVVSGFGVLRAAVRSLCRGRMLDENFLMAVASLAAIAIGEVA